MMIRGIRPIEVRPVLHSKTIEPINATRTLINITMMKEIEIFMNWYSVLAL